MFARYMTVWALRKRKSRKGNRIRTIEKRRLGCKDVWLTGHSRRLRRGKTCWQPLRSGFSITTTNDIWRTSSVRTIVTALLKSWDGSVGCNRSQSVFTESSLPLAKPGSSTKPGMPAFRNFLLYGEQGLAGQETLITIFQDTLTLEYGEYPLSKYAVEWQSDDHHLFRIGNPRLYQHPYHTPQLPLWDATDVEWHVIIRCTPKARRKKRLVRSFVLQSPLDVEGAGM